MSSSNINIPPPDISVLQLVSALSNADNHDLHVQAIRARDEALSGSMESYNSICIQLARLLWGSDDPFQMLSKMDANHLQTWQQQSEAARQLTQQESLWIQFGQLAGLILKQALLSPPLQQQHQSLHLIAPASDEVKEILLACLNSKHSPLRAVASSVIATAAVSLDSVQPLLSVQQWPQLLPTLLQNLNSNSADTVDGSLVTIRKMMEDGPSALDQNHLDSLIPLLLKFFTFPKESHKVASLQSIMACLEDGYMPNALVLHFADYLAGLSALATDPSPNVRKWVCRSIVTLLVLRTEYIQPHMQAISQFMLNSTADTPEVALDACEFWLTFTTLEEDVVTKEMVATIQNLLPQLIPILLKGMVYSPEQQEELLFRNQVELDQKKEEFKPVFHKMKMKHAQEEPDSDDDEDDDDDDFDDDGNEWNLRKCSAASLDSLAAMYGPQPVLPALLPELEKGLASQDPWHQEASMLALGAIAEGCRHAMYPHLQQIHPFLLNILQQQSLPQLVQISAWTMGRYASWAVEQVQTGAQGHLLATMVEVLMARLEDKNRRVQVACCSAFGVIVEAAGDLLVPYLEPIYRHLVSAMTRFQSRSLLIVFDTLGVMADFVGPAIGEGVLPSIYIPPLLHLWNETAKHNPADRLLLPLLESLASIALVCGVNYQPYALETFDTCMCTIESVTLQLTTAGEYIDDDQDVDPIVCAADLLDGMVEGLGANFANLVSSSSRYGPHFSTVLVALAKHEVPGVRMSAFALVGDLAVKAPSVLEPALAEILKESLSGLDPTHAGVCANAVWAIGEICVRCENNPAPIEPFASNLIQQLIPLIMGNADGIGGGVLSLQGVTANAAATMGRLAKVNPNFVAPDLPRFLVGWCDGLAKVSDPSERRDGFQGFVLALHANPQAIQSASTNVVDTISIILFTIVSWHVPNTSDGDMMQNFEPFPPNETELQNSLGKLMHDLKNSVGKETWDNVYQQIPVNVRRLLRETYQL